MTELKCLIATGLRPIRWRPISSRWAIMARSRSAWVYASPQPTRPSSVSILTKSQVLLLPESTRDGVICLTCIGPSLLCGQPRELCGDSLRKLCPIPRDLLAEDAHGGVPRTTIPDIDPAPV